MQTIIGVSAQVTPGVLWRVTDGNTNVGLFTTLRDARLCLQSVMNTIDSCLDKKQWHIQVRKGGFWCTERYR